MTNIYHIVSNNTWGGGEQYVYDLCRRQIADGIDVEIFCRPIEVVVEKFKELGVGVYPLRLGGAIDLVSAWRMARIVNKSEACYIHAHNFKDAFTAAYASKLSRGNVRVVMCRHLTRPGKTGLHYRWLYKNVEKIVMDSQVARDTFFSTHPQIEPEKVDIVHTSIVVPSEVPSIDLRSELDIKDNRVVAMYHGRLDPEKGLDVLLDAVEKIKDKNFILALIGRGTTEYTSKLSEKIRAGKLGQRVRIMGFRHPVMPYVAVTDFGILASTVREGCPLSPMEYMSQGHPVIATDNGGQREYLADGQNALLVPPNDTDALAKAMARMIDDEELRRRLGAQAKADFDSKLNYEQFYNQIKQIYDKSGN